MYYIWLILYDAKWFISSAIFIQSRPSEVNALIYYYPRLVRIAVFGTNPSFGVMGGD